jgi:hypothetical protein
MDRHKIRRRAAGTVSKEAAYGRGAVRRRALPPEFYLIYMVF